MRGIGETHFGAIEAYDAVASRVSHLGLWCGPTAVIWRVAFRVIYAIKRQARWFFSHVTKEHPEVGPFWMDGNASSAVIRERWVVGVAASIKHCCPNFIGAGLVHPMFCHLSDHQIDLFASTRAGMAKSKVACANLALGSTSALCQISKVAVSLLRKTEDGPFSEYIACDKRLVLDWHI
jgi:hypothetical protein